MIAHLVVVRYGRERRVLHDGHHRDEEGIGASYDRGQLRPEERLQQRVDAGDEEQRLHYPHPVSLQPIRDGKPRTPPDIVGTETCDARRQPMGGGANQEMQRRTHVAPAHHGHQHRRDHDGRAQRQDVVLEVSLCIWFFRFDSVRFIRFLVYTVFILRFIRFYT